MPAAFDVSDDSRGKRRLPHRERLIGGLADRQYGVVSRRQLIDLGLSNREVEYRLGTGALRPLHRGVYSVGHRVVPRNGRLRAAVLACGPAATLSHRSAAALWDLRVTSPKRTDVITAKARRSQQGIRLHRYTLAPDERTVHEGIPVTTPARTLLDLASVLPRHRLERAVNEAEVQRIFDGRALARLLARHSRRPGAPALRAVLADLDLGARITDTRDVDPGVVLGPGETAGVKHGEEALLELAGAGCVASPPWSPQTSALCSIGPDHRPTCPPEPPTRPTWRSEPPTPTAEPLSATSSFDAAVRSRRDASPGAARRNSYARPVPLPATSLFWSLGLLGIIICAIAVAALVIPMFRERRDDD